MKTVKMMTIAGSVELQLVCGWSRGWYVRMRVVSNYRLLVCHWHQ